jgi:hypothetical protein
MYLRTPERPLNSTGGTVETLIWFDPHISALDRARDSPAPGLGGQCPPINFVLSDQSIGETLSL